MAKVKLSKPELKDYLGARIRESARWKIKYQKDEVGIHSFGGPGFDEDKHLSEVAQLVYDDIITSYHYDEPLLDATRSVEKWGVGYIKKVIRDAVKKGLLKYECDMRDHIERTLTETNESDIDSGKVLRRLLDDSQ
jgi:hypothetical protein